MVTTISSSVLALQTSVYIILSSTTAGEDRDDKDAAQHGDAGASGAVASGARAPCVAGEFRVALDTLFDTLSETQAW